jgi:hypothetical protein
MTKRIHRSLAHLERELHAHDAKRLSILQEIKAAVESLAIGAAFTVGRIAQETGLGASLPEKTGKRTMSADARARISAAQKARWAERRGGAVVAPIAAKRRTMSPEAKKRMSAGMRRYWAKRKAAKGKLG